MKRLLLATFILLAPVQGLAFTCAQVYWAMDHFPKKVLDYYIAKATPEQLAQGRACIEARNVTAVSAPIIQERPRSRHRHKRTTHAR